MVLLILDRNEETLSIVTPARLAASVGESIKMSGLAVVPLELAVKGGLLFLREGDHIPGSQDATVFCTDYGGKRLRRRR